MTKLSLVDQDQGTWYPVSIDRLVSLLAKAIVTTSGFGHVYALRRNLAYNLQYIEFLDRCLLDLKLSNVLVTQTYKTVVVVGCGCIESLLHYLAIKRGVAKQTEWEPKQVFFGNGKKVDGEVLKCDSHIYVKLGRPKLVSMTFDSLIQKARSRKMLGSDASMYSKLDRLRGLRNKVHLQEIQREFDTDWNSFNYEEVADMAGVLLGTFTSNIFHPSAEEEAYFDYLKRYAND